MEYEGNRETRGGGGVPQSGGGGHCFLLMFREDLSEKEKVNMG